MAVGLAVAPREQGVRRAQLGGKAGLLDRRGAVMRSRLVRPQALRSHFTEASMKLIALLALALLVPQCLGLDAATAQQMTGTPGAPSGTVTIEGSQIPAPPQK